MMMKRLRARWYTWRLRKRLRLRARMIEEKLGWPKGSIEFSINPEKL